MLTECYSISGNCPCLDCDRFCCFGKKTDTEELCDRAREYCEGCAIEHQKRGGRQ
jgi:hypothetical protein